MKIRPSFEVESWNKIFQIKIPKIKGIIDRRILINYQVDREVLGNFLPKPFKPKLVNGKGIAGICLIRLKEIRPKGLPKFMGISSENGAHRIAVGIYSTLTISETHGKDLDFVE